MSSLKLNKLGFLVAGASLLALFAAQGCSSDDDSQAAPTAGSAGTAGKAGNGNGEGGSGDTSSEGGSGNVGNVGNTGGNTEGGAPGEAGFGGEAGSAPTGNCTDKTGCYTCTPTNSAQFENKCVTGGCPDTFTDVLSKKALVGTL